MKPTDFAIYLSRYLGDYLPNQRNVSPNTIKSYRDTFSLLIHYCKDVKKIQPERLNFDSLEPITLTDFLSYLEQVRGCKSRTRNQRLAAIHAFFRYLQSELPERLVWCQRIMSIPFHRCEKLSIPYLNVSEVELLFARPDTSTDSGRRDALMLRVLYDTGARVQELCDLRLRDVRLDSPPSIQLTGKGRKTRIVPLMKGTLSLLKPYIEHVRNGINDSEPLFTNRAGHKFTRSGVTYLIDKYCAMARGANSGFTKDVSPHVFRHSKAMHLLQAGNSLSVIQAILGHVDIKTVGIYASADLEMKRKAMERTEPSAPKSQVTSWQRDQSLMAWLKNL
jgi:site-specific recombinase XerD